jgi:hypothetical protein
LKTGASSSRRSGGATTELWIWKLHKRLHNHRKLELVQAPSREKAATCTAFAEPSSGLEPETPSLPCDVGGDAWLQGATVSACSGPFSGLRRTTFAPGCARVTAGFGRGSREIKWYRRKGRQLAFAPTQKQVDRFRKVSEPLIAAMGEALDDATEYGNARRGYAACALTDVLHAQFKLALARFKAGELDYATEVEDVLRKVPEQRRQISELEDR